LAVAVAVEVEFGLMRIDIGCILSIESEVVVLGEAAYAVKASEGSAVFNLAIYPSMFFPNLMPCGMGDCGVGVHEVVRRDSHVPLR